MALDMLIDSAQLDEDLTSVADAIREKGDTSAHLQFPDGFVEAIQELPAGSVPKGTKAITITENGTYTENVSDYANAQITVTVPQPSGSTTLTDNGTFNIAQYATVVVAIPSASGVNF